ATEVPPALVVQASMQVTRVAQWPAPVHERRLVHGLLTSLSAQCATHFEEYSLRELAAVLGACARAHHVPEELLLPLQLRLSADARQGRLE
ncbi:hypothetical protein TSOC_003974, partial [Tetrabaena socialis]